MHHIGYNHYYNYNLYDKINIKKIKNTNIHAYTHTYIHNLSFAKKVSAIKSLFSSKGLSWPNIKWVQVDEAINKAKNNVNIMQ